MAVKAANIAFRPLANYANGAVGQYPGVCHLIGSAAKWNEMGLPKDLADHHVSSDSLLRSVDFSKQIVIAFTSNGGNGHRFELKGIKSDAHALDIDIETAQPGPNVPQMGYTSTLVLLYTVDLASVPATVNIHDKGKASSFMVLRHL